MADTNQPALTLYLHPLASFCHKVLLALYENETPFEARVVDLGDPASSAELMAHWPVGKIPVLRDHARQKTVAETTIILEYLAQHYPGRLALLPAERDAALEARLWDRFFDLYVQVPMQKVVVDRLRPAGKGDAFGVAEAEAVLTTAYGMLERQLEGRTWAIGEAFTIADCAAAPALFYAQAVLPFASEWPSIASYFERLLARASFARVLREAQPFMVNFPLRDRLEERFR